MASLASAANRTSRHQDAEHTGFSRNRMGTDVSPRTNDGTHGIGAARRPVSSMRTHDETHSFTASIMQPRPRSQTLLVGRRGAKEENTRSVNVRDIDEALSSVVKEQTRGMGGDFELVDVLGVRGDPDHDGSLKNTLPSFRSLLSSTRGGGGGAGGGGTRGGFGDGGRDIGDGEMNRALFSTKSAGVIDRDHPSERHAGRMVLPNYCCIISPDHDFYAWWDPYVLILLVFTASVTPFEVAFLPPLNLAGGITGLFVINRIVDVSFIADMVLQFLTAKYLPLQHRWANSHWEIAMAYLRTWFLPDFISIFPFEFIGLATGEEEWYDLKVLRVLRLFRLLKLMRLVRAGRILRRWETSISLRYSVMQLWSFVIAGLLAAHWLACLWRLSISDISQPEGTWAEELGFDGDTNVWRIYLASIYFSIMTTTTIGYGDIHPTNDLERGIACICMIVGASMYAYVVGVCSSIASQMDRATNEFHQTMDDLNLFMEENGVPFGMRKQLRRYFQHTRRLSRELSFSRLLAQMSPTLRMRVASHCHATWIRSVPFFNDPLVPEIEREYFIMELAMRLYPASFGPNELVVRPNEPAVSMFIIKSGLIMRTEPNIFTKSHESHFRIDKPVAVGTDFIMTDYRRPYSVRTLNFLDCYVLSKDALIGMLQFNEFPETAQAIRRACIRMALRYKFPALAMSVALIRRAKKKRMKRRIVDVASVISAMSSSSHRSRTASRDLDSENKWAEATSEVPTQTKRLWTSHPNKKSPSSLESTDEEDEEQDGGKKRPSTSSLAAKVSEDEDGALTPRFSDTAPPPQTTRASQRGRGTNHPKKGIDNVPRQMSLPAQFHAAAPPPPPPAPARMPHASSVQNKSSGPTPPPPPRSPTRTSQKLLDQEQDQDDEIDRNPSIRSVSLFRRVANGASPSLSLEIESPAGRPRAAGNIRSNAPNTPRRPTKTVYEQALIATVQSQYANAARIVAHLDDSDDDILGSSSSGSDTSTDDSIPNPSGRVPVSLSILSPPEQARAAVNIASTQAMSAAGIPPPITRTESTGASPAPPTVGAAGAPLSSTNPAFSVSRSVMMSPAIAPTAPPPIPTTNNVEDDIRSLRADIHSLTRAVASLAKK